MKIYVAQIFGPRGGQQSSVLYYHRIAAMPKPKWNQQRLLQSVQCVYALCSVKTHNLCKKVDFRNNHNLIGAKKLA